VEDYAARTEVMPAGVRAQDLGYRGGYCGTGEWLYFHWKNILLPARIAEYVVVHEMAHLSEPHHTPEFWRRVERALPDFERRRDGWPHAERLQRVCRLQRCSRGIDCRR
jgi:predicted metal-dependent hydrolase